MRGRGRELRPGRLDRPPRHVLLPPRLSPLFLTALALDLKCGRRLEAANILLINLIIAVFNNVFQHMNAQSQQLWRFTRYFQVRSFLAWTWRPRVAGLKVMEYESSPPFPPPFIILCDLYRIGKRLRRWFRSRPGAKQEARMDLTLSPTTHPMSRLEANEDRC